MKKTIAAIAMLGLAACSDPDTASRAARAVGLKDIRIDGYRFAACSRGEWFHTAFEAMNANGERVTGVVCSGWLKGATVRFD